jgi:Fe2+ transport system protein B
VCAKEAVVASLSLFYGFSCSHRGADIHAALSSVFTPLSAYFFDICSAVCSCEPPFPPSIRNEQPEMTLFSVVWQLLVSPAIMFLSRFSAWERFGIG